MKKQKISLGVFLFGILVLVAGIVTMLVNFLSTPAMRDAEYLVSVGEFSREDAPGVIWDFREVGKGILTTDNHVNDYAFLWAIEGEKLKIETDWLYELNDEYDFKIDQEAGILTLNPGEGEIVFRMAEDEGGSEGEAEAPAVEGVSE